MLGVQLRGRLLYVLHCEKLERPVFAGIGLTRVQMQYPAADSCRLSQPPHGAVRSKAYFQDPGLGHLQDGFLISELTIESLVCVLGLECLLLAHVGHAGGHCTLILEDGE
jgi:hypothetical protein